MKDYTLKIILFLSIVLIASCKKPDTPKQVELIISGFEKHFGGAEDDVANSIISVDGAIYIYGSTKSMNEINGDPID